MSWFSDISLSRGTRFSMQHPALVARSSPVRCKPYVKRFSIAFVIVLLCLFALSWRQLAYIDTIGGGSDDDILISESVDMMGTLRNETIRAELGRSTWTFLHTMAARFPDNPSASERASVSEFLNLLSVLYPCGDCATHFAALLLVHPPELDTKDTFIQWLCKVHNLVNERLGKRIFPCDTVKDRWTCGCKDDV